MTNWLLGDPIWFGSPPGKYDPTQILRFSVWSAQILDFSSQNTKNAPVWVNLMLSNAHKNIINYSYNEITDC
jgi:hypothetical protein